MSEPETKTLFVKISVVNTMNQVIQYLEQKKTEGQPIPKELEIIDMKFQLICSHLEEIAKRALVLKDPLLITHLVALQILEEKEKQAQEPKKEESA